MKILLAIILLNFAAILYGSPALVIEDKVVFVSYNWEGSPITPISTLPRDVINKIQKYSNQGYIITHITSIPTSYYDRISLINRGVILITMEKREQKNKDE